MSTVRLMGIAFIFVCASVAWFVLGQSVVVRTGQSNQTLSREVAGLWGEPHTQIAPGATIERPRVVSESVEEKGSDGRTVTREVVKTIVDKVVLPPDCSRVQVSLALDHRRKGLLWYDTYEVGFKGEYDLRNPDEVERKILIHLAFPSKQAIYDAFMFRVGGAEVPFAGELTEGVTGVAVLPPGGTTRVEVAYRSRGMDTWSYAFSPAGVGQVKDLTLKLHTDFDGIDFTPGTISPGDKTPSGQGWDLTWRFDNLVTGQRIGIDLPNRLNPGPLAARITFFAPVGLLFFMTVMVLLGVLNGRSLHPMNYFFLAAAFFAFHLMLAYLVDHVHIHTAFAISAATSIFLVISYLRLVGGMRMALAQAGLAQLVFLVLFSYAFFFEGFTGLTITVGAVITLFVLMQLTARVDWGKALSGWAAVEPT